jgi:hypothetical protein
MAGGSASYYTTVEAAARQAALNRAAAEARQAYLWKQAATAATRLAAGEKAYQEGDIRVASRIYLKLALSRKKTPAAAEAKQRLTQLAEEAREKVRGIDARLVAQQGVSSPGEWPATAGPPPVGASAPGGDLVTEAFRQYDQLARQYGGVPAASRELRGHVARQRRRPQYAAVLNEPEARALWEAAQQHEAKDERCCAYWVYRRAARLVPAPSAQLARDRLAELQQDPEVVASAEVCRKLRECHKIYTRAERLSELKPGRAQELYAEVVRRAPRDSEVYRLAQTRVEGR